MLSRLAFYPTLAYNVLVDKVTSRAWYTRIDETVLLGALPFRGMMSELIAENVKGVVSMNEDFELQHFVPSEQEWRSAGIEQLRLQTVDLVAAPTQEKLERGVKFIETHRRYGNSVYVHCKAGRTRSTTLVACYLMQVHQWSPDKAVEYIKEKRPHIWLRTTQWDALHLFYKNLVSSSDRRRQRGS